jgi:hypothetical protein
MHALRSDTAVYKHITKDVVSATYVDDMINTSPTEEETARLCNALSEDLEIKELGFPQHFLSVALQQQEDGSITLSQATYVDEILETFSMKDYKTASIPMKASAYKEAIRGTGTDSLPQYASLVGKLIYLITQTRPDIAFATGIWLRFLMNPTAAQYNEVKHILRYL